MTPFPTVGSLLVCIFSTVGTVVSFGVALFWYSCYLETAEIDDTKRFLRRHTWFIFLYELGAFCLGLSSNAYFCVALLATVWGHLDGVWRYPMANELFSYFGLKIAALTILRTILFFTGFHYAGPFGFLFNFFLLVLSAPLFYIFSMPFDDVKPMHSPLENRNRDMILKLYDLLSVPLKRRHACFAVRSVIDRWFISAVTYSPAVGMLLKVFPLNVQHDYRSKIRKSSLKQV